MTERVRKGYADTSDGQIHFRSLGSGRPLILIHQSPSSSQQFNALLEPLARRGFRVVAIDMPGYGSSDVPESAPDLAGYATRIQEAIRSIGFDNVDLFGHHTGASVAMMLGANYPSLVRRIVLWGAPFLSAEGMARLANEGPREYSIGGDELPAMMQGRNRMSGPNITLEMSHRFLIERLQLGSHSHWGHNAVGREDHVALAQRVSQPTLITCSVGDGSTFEASKVAVAHFPNATFVEFFDASLDVPDEKPEELAEVIAGFLHEDDGSDQTDAKGDWPTSGIP